MCTRSIMHNDDMQVIHNLARLVHNPLRDHMYTRRDHVYSHCYTYSRDRNRRT